MTKQKIIIPMYLKYDFIKVLKYFIKHNKKGVSMGALKTITGCNFASNKIIKTMEYKQGFDTKFIIVDKNYKFQEKNFLFE